jgi:hypothetical protein
MSRWTKRSAVACVVAAMVPVLTGAKGKGCDGSAWAKSEAPDMSGQWAVTYDDRLDVEITIGGATYTAELGPEGGSVTIDHDGQPLVFDLDCAREDVVCPSEVWPAVVGFRQDDAQYPHRVWLQVPKQSCSGQLVAADPSTCGDGTENPECAPVCSGEVITTTQEAFGTIDQAGESFWVGLGASIASNGINCALLGGSAAQGDLGTEGKADDGTWRAVTSTGEVVTMYVGGCLWAGDPDSDGATEALVLGATVRFATGYTAERI